jgi:hypothetical protein
MQIYMCGLHVSFENHREKVRANSPFIIERSYQCIKKIIT